MQIRTPTTSDIEAIVDLHYSSKVEGILGHLPKETLRDYFYTHILEKDSNLSLAAFDTQGKIVGFCCLSNERKSYPNAPLATKLRVVTSLIENFFTHPRIFGLIFNHLRAERMVRRGEEYNKALELKIMIVDSRVTNKGIGTSLMSELLSKAPNRHPILVRTQNPAALRFYRRFGFRFLGRTKIGTQTLWLGLLDPESRSEQL